MAHADRWLSESAKILPILAPVDTTGSTWASDVINLESYGHVTIVVQQGAWAGGSSTMTVEYCDNNTPTTDTAMAFRYYQFVGGAGASDTIGTLTDGTSSGISLGTANTTTIIELDANEIAVADSSAGNARLIVKGTSPGANTDLICAFAVLSVPKYSGLTAID